MAIQVLADTVISQIAAGEVIERPASVIKELVENSLDAGATSVQIVIKGGGRHLMRVADNGSGILTDEVELAFARHATSKLRTADDLSALQTLGFRGEALSSIASVSRTTLISRHREEQLGTHIRIEGVKLLENQPFGAPAGTVITVENLFFNTPARLKFLKQESTEKRHITALITRYAMAYPHVRFTLEHDNREVFRSSGSGQLADVIVKTLSLENFKQMIEIDVEQIARDGKSDIRVSGYTSLPVYNRADRTHITLFVNGRWVQDSSLTYAIVQAYHSLLPSSRYPVSVVMIELPPDEVDVNVHPTKAEVRFRNANAVFGIVQRAIRHSVITATQNPALQENRLRHYQAEEPTIATESWNPGQYQRRQIEMGLSFDEPANRSSDEREWENYDDDDPRSIPSGVGAPKKPRTLPMLRVVGQVGAMYIVAEGPAGMYLIDQRAAHERIVYDDVLDTLEIEARLESQDIIGETFDCNAREARLIDRHIDTWLNLGFHVEAFGPNSYKVRSAPVILGQNEPVMVIKAALSQLLDSQSPDDDFEDIVVAQIAKHASIKSGQILNPEQMQDVVRRLERVRSPHACPDGRPTMIHMSGDQLAQEFRR